MSDRENHEAFDFDDDHRWREREMGRRFESERPTWSGDDRGRGRHEGGTYGQHAWRGSAQRSQMHDDQRHGPRRDTGETWGQGRTYRDQAGREDFGQYGQTGVGGDYGQHRGPYSDAAHQFGPGGYGLRGGRGQGDFSAQGGGAFGAGGYPVYGQRQSGYGEQMSATGRELAGDFEPEYGQGHQGGHAQPYPGQAHRHEAAFGRASRQGDFEADYLHWRDSQMRRLDEDYHRWREERRAKFAQDFDDWRSRRETTAQTSQAAHSSQGAGGQSGQSSMSGLNNPIVSHVADGDTDLHKDDKKKS
jgi:hypothetical protein